MCKSRINIISIFAPDMNKARLTFLGSGTSQGVPMIGCDCPVCKSADPRDRHLRSSVLVEYCGLTLP